MDNLENSDKNISLPFDALETDEEIEVLEDPRRSAKEVIKDTASSIQNKASEIKENIQNQDIYETNIDIPIIKATEKPRKKMEKVLKIQIALIVLWVVLTLSLYLFGYELFEPFIPIN